MKIVVNKLDFTIIINKYIAINFIIICLYIFIIILHIKNVYFLLSTIYGANIIDIS